MAKPQPPRNALRLPVFPLVEPTLRTVSTRAQRLLEKVSLGALSERRCRRPRPALFDEAPTICLPQPLNIEPQV
jgi:hypothetical protein